MKIVITDWKTVTNGDLSLDPIRSFGEVTAYPLTAPADVAARIADADVVLCNKTPMTADVLRSAPNLRYIGLFATGYNNIDLDYTNAHGITVCNAGGYSTDAVAQHVFALLLHRMSQIAAYDRFTAEGHWIGSDVFSPFCYPMRELCGMTMGIVGYGNIGKAVARIALAFGMKVLVYTRTPKDDHTVSFVPLDTLLTQSDVVTVHCPLNDASKWLFNAQVFATMKPGAFFINTSRGGVVEETALRQALDSGHLGGAAVDVLDAEPMREDCPLLGAPRLTITPHVAWAPLQTRERLLALVCDNLRAFLDGAPQNVVK